MLMNKGAELFKSLVPNSTFFDLQWKPVPLKQLFHQRMHSLQRLDVLDS